MIFWGQNRVAIIDGDIKKREAIIKPLYWDKKEKPLLVGWEDLRSDGGHLEILRAIKKVKEEKE